MKYNNLGFSVYLSSFENQKNFLRKIKNQQRLIFTSLHMQEEMNGEYKNRIIEMLDWLKENNFKVICDISKRTLNLFEVTSILELARILDVAMLRIDYGFSIDEIIQASKQTTIVMNASTIDVKDMGKIKNIYGLHNFYPREDTGLSNNQFISINQKLTGNEIGILTFIPNHKIARGPIFAGLPTIEQQRNQNPYVSFIEMNTQYDVSGILLGDLGVDQTDLEYIERYEKEKVISIPVTLTNEALYDKIFTIRTDSPEKLLRIQESREFASYGEEIAPNNAIERLRGSITCDNVKYLRYSGEIQIIKENLKQDDRINVIGNIAKEYEDICDFLPNGSKIMFKK